MVVAGDRVAGLYFYVQVAEVEVLYSLVDYLFVVTVWSIRFGYLWSLTGLSRWCSLRDQSVPLKVCHVL
ncbi:hypothetical protein BDV40DRAFT_283073, partial [Aspergillus tamarii]